MRALLLLLLAFPARAQVKTGIDVLEEARFAPLAGKRIGLITNQTGIDRAGRSDVDVLAAARGVSLQCLFSPEHGFTGKSHDSRIDDGQIEAGGRRIPLYSLYKGGVAGMKPAPDELSGVDALVFDIQDIGARFYTYMATMARSMEAAQERDIDFFVLDRPNPITGSIVEGAVVEDYKTYRKTLPTAYFPIATRHGMTAGEIATLYAAELRYGKLHVIKLEGWSRGMWLDQTGLPGWDADPVRRPSPNIPDLASAILYPGIALFEPSNLSVGRGVEGSQFQIVGAPWLDAARVVAALKRERLKGAAFSAEDFTPGENKAYPYYGKVCHGVRIAITDRKALRPLTIFVALTRAIRLAHPESGAPKLEWRGGGAAVMTGLRDFEALYKANPDMRAVQKLFDRGAAGFAASRRPYLLY